MRGIKIPQYEFALKIHGGLMREGGGGAYLRDTTVHENLVNYCTFVFPSGYVILHPTRPSKITC